MDVIDYDNFNILLNGQPYPVPVYGRYTPACREIIQYRFYFPGGGSTISLKHTKKAPGKPGAIINDI